MKKILLSLCVVFSFASLSAGMLDTVAARVAEFGRWDPEGIQKILVDHNNKIDEQIRILENPDSVDLENPPVEGKKSYERSKQEIITELLAAATASVIKAIDKQKFVVIKRLKAQKELNNKVLAKMMRMVTDYNLQVKVVRLLREIAKTNEEIMRGLQSGKKTESVKNLLRKAKRGTLKSKVMLALGFSKKEIFQMLIHSEPRAGQTDKEREKSLGSAIKEAKKEGATP